ncbi:MAG: hypothetical protein ABI779_03330 [Acidobacteriota bacterium]
MLLIIGPRQGLRLARRGWLRAPLPLGLRWLLLLSLLRFLPLPALRLRTALLAFLLLAALLLPPLLRLRRTLVATACLAGPLLELPDLLLHEAARLRILLGAQLIVSTVRTTLPSFGVGFPAGGTENTFWERHR